MIAAVVVDFHNAVDHQHVGSRQLTVPRPEKLSPAAGQKIIAGEVSTERPIVVDFADGEYRIEA